MFYALHKTLSIKLQKCVEICDLSLMVMLCCVFMYLFICSNRERENIFRKSKI